jgi:nucleoside-diphosphate-sugar epimerase
LKVLITGGAGYLGSVLTNLLLQNGYEVRVVDLLWFDKLIPLIHYSNPKYEFIYGDIRDDKVIDECLDEVDYVVHAAAVVGDPASKKYPEMTKEINEEASINIIEKARAEQIKGIVFTSTCSNYGKVAGTAKEDHDLSPLSLYAETKVNVEKHLIENVNDLGYVIARLSTIYGVSPRQRFDLTVNDFTLNAFRNKYLDIFLPESYRPYIHVYDCANVLFHFINDFNAVRNNIFNIGFEGENYKKIEIAETVMRHISGVKIEILKEGGDPRDYKVDFSKLKKHLSLTNYYNVEKSVQEIVRVLELGLIDDYDDEIYYNTSPDLK